MREVESFLETFFEKIGVSGQVFISKEMIDGWFPVVIDHKKRSPADVIHVFILGNVARDKFIERHVRRVLRFGFDFVARAVAIPTEQPVGWLATQAGCFQGAKAGLVYVWKDKPFVASVPDVFDTRVIDEGDVAMREQGHLDTGRSGLWHGQECQFFA